MSEPGQAGATGPRGEKGEKGEPSETFTLSQRTALFMALALIIAGSIPATLLTLIVGPTIIANRSTIEAIVDAERTSCEADVQFRQQYRTRAIAEKALLTLFLDLAHQSVTDPAIPPDQRRTSEDFIKEFKPLTDDIIILPLIDCEALAEDLEEHL